MPRIPTLAGLEGNVPKLAALRFLCWMHLMSAVIIPFFREWGRLSFVQIFALQTWFMVACFLMEVPTGAVADRFGRKVSVACGGFLLAAASLLYGSFPLLAVFVVGEGLFAVAITLISGADEALAYDSLLAQGRQAEASRVMARLEAAKLAGILAGALVGAAGPGTRGGRMGDGRRGRSALRQSRGICIRSNVDARADRQAPRIRTAGGVVPRLIPARNGVQALTHL